MNNTIIDFIVHEACDTVGVIVVEGINSGQSLTGWIMQTDETVSLTINADVPIGHKIAVKAVSEGDAAIKYGEDIGKMVIAANLGDHVHTHNLKTKRW